MSGSGNDTHGAFDESEVEHVFVAIGVPFIVLWTVVTPIFMAVVLRSCGGKASLKRDSRFFRQSPVSSFFWMFWLLIEFGQVNWFSFIEVVDWPGQPLLDFFNVFMLYYDIPWEAWFWIYACIAIVILSICLGLMCCCDGSGDDIMGITAFVLMVMIPIFQPAMYRMVQALTCTYPIGEAPFLDAMPDMECWQGLHILYVVFACLVVAVFYPVITVMMSLMLAGRNVASIWVVFAIMQFKMVQVVVGALFKTYTLGVLLAMMFINLLFVILSFVAPHLHVVVNMIRLLSFSMATWATICILIQLGVNDPNSWVGVILLIVGWVLLPILCFFLWRWLKSKAATSAASSGLPLASAPSSPPPPPPPPGPVIVSASASASASASSAPAAAPGPVVVIQHIHVSNPPPPSPHYHYPPPSPSAPPRPSVPPVFAVPPPGLSVHSAYPVDD